MTGTTSRARRGGTATASRSSSRSRRRSAPRASATSRRSGSPSSTACAGNPSGATSVSSSGKPSDSGSGSTPTTRTGRWTRSTSRACGGRSSSCTTEGLLFQDDRITTYCPRCGTPLSDAEVAMGYADVEDPSVFIRFCSRGVRGRSTRRGAPARVDDHALDLISNTGLAVAPQAPYVMVEQEGERYVLAKDRLEDVLPDARPVGRQFDGATLVEARYGAHRTWRRRLVADFVSLRDSTGVDHLCPPFGPEDLVIGRPRGVEDVQADRRRGAVHRRGSDVRPGPVLQGRRPADHGRSAFARPAAACGDPRARLPCAGAATRRCSTSRGALGTREPRRSRIGCSRSTRASRGTRTTSSMGATATGSKTTWTGRSPGALLGDAATDLAVHQRPRHGDRLAGRVVRAGGTRRNRHRPPIARGSTR